MFGSEATRRRVVATLLGSLVAWGVPGAFLLRAAGHQAASLRSGPHVAVTPDRLLGCACAALAGTLLGWLFLAGVITAVAGRPGAVGRGAERAARRVVPAVLQAALTAALTGSLVATATGAATAADRGPAPGWTSAPAASAPAAAQAWAPAPAAGPAPGWTPASPDRPAATAPDIGLVTNRPHAGRHVDEHIVVRRGDTLWSIAARHLGRRAGAAEIAREWPRWFAVNRPVIGSDPDRLQAGQLLRPPSHPGRPGAHREGAR
jgi:LysM domain